ncbi:MAG: hypothetical protein ACYTGL_00045 [Planctomycetota bacterium]|jgi:hypothetical protein
MSEVRCGQITSEWSPLIFVFEPKPRWYPELRRQLSETGLRIQSASTAAQVRSILDDVEKNGPAGPVVLLVDLEVGAGTILALTAAYAERPEVRLSIVGYPETQPLEPVLRELGADSFHVLPVAGEQLAAECVRLAGVSVPAAIG